MDSSKTISYVTFNVGSMRFGINASEVQEFLFAQRVSQVPLSSPVIAGLINLRGQIITAINLRTRLNLPPHSDHPPFNIVVRSDKAIRSLQVDSIGGVVEVAAEDHGPPPRTLPAELRSLLREVCRLNGNLLLILNSGQLFEGFPSTLQPAYS